MHFYISSFIRNNHILSLQIGVGWISNNLNIKFNAAISSYPNLICNQLEALIYLLLIIPNNSNINIHLNNSTIIKNLQLILPSYNLTQLKNCDILNIIYQIKNKKNIEFILHKIKSHSPNTFQN
jgi:hypothetical protein